MSTFIHKAAQLGLFLGITAGLGETTASLALAQHRPWRSIGDRDPIRAIVAQSALSNCYLLRAGVNSKTAFRANAAAAISHLKDTKELTYEKIPANEEPRFRRLISLQILSATNHICPALIPTNLRQTLEKIETKLYNSQQ